MKRIKFTKQDIELLSKDPRVKYVDEYSIRFKLEFRQQLYNETYPDFTNPSLRSAFKKLNFDYNFSWEIYHNLCGSFKKRRPNGAKNDELYFSLGVTKTDKTYDGYLLSTAKFKQSRNGITPTDEFLEEIYNVYPTIKVEDYLSSIGIDLTRFGYQRIYNIQKEIESPTPREIHFDDKQIESLKINPYIKRINENQISFKDNFYSEAKVFYHLHINDILRIFEINPDWINYSRKNKIKYKIKSFGNRVLKPLNSNIKLLIKIETNKIVALNKMVSDDLDILKTNVKKYTCSQRKELCYMIKEITHMDNTPYNVRELLNKIGISKSSYYSILKDTNYGEYELKKNIQDEIEVEKIKTVINSNKYPKGNRMIYMLLDRNGWHMSRKKIYRLCNKFDIKCKIREHNNSREAANEILERNCKPNLLKRKFKLTKPNDVTLTDVSYLKCSFGTCYLSAIKDACSGKVRLLVSENNDLNLVLDTLDLIPISEQIKIFHSDQGILYLNDTFQKKLQEIGYVQSMSKRGNCWDNAPQESFFGHMKDEVDFNFCETFEDVVVAIKEYEYYYNYERPQWNRCMMTPIEYEKYINSLNDYEYKKYYDKELIKYNKMMENAKIKAINRSKDIGIESFI